MASFNVETRIAHPAPEVFRCYRDDMAKAAVFIPNIKGIEVRERTEEGATVKLVNHWRAKAEIPGPLKAMISEDKLGWLDHATWNATTSTCDWRLEITAFKDAVDCRGQTRFVADGDKAARMIITGQLSVDASKVGVPRMLAGSVGKAVEAFAVALIKPNLEEMGRAVGRYLSEKR
jgi:hypothetical protein